MEFRKFLMEELKKTTSTLQKYEDKLMQSESGTVDAAMFEYLKTSIEFYRAQAVELRKQIFETKGSLA